MGTQFAKKAFAVVGAAKDYYRYTPEYRNHGGSHKRTYEKHKATFEANSRRFLRSLLAALKMEGTIEVVKQSGVNDSIAVKTNSFYIRLSGGRTSRERDGSPSFVYQTVKGDVKGPEVMMKYEDLGIIPERFVKMLQELQSAA